MSDENHSAEDMWRAYLESVGELPDTTDRSMTVDHFGMDPDTATELAKLVLEGKKRATASALWMYEHDSEPLPYEGLYTVIVDGQGLPICIVRTTRIDVMPFDEVDADFAAEEGEGDLTLAYWRDVHRKFFTEELATIGRSFDESMPVVCERFAKVYPPGEERRSRGY